ncbi:MAG: alpha/beta hydrolase [Lachnospiraceae bacterium]|nr:alpha/beta hydrolase [Lachnospiraceae bacterium]
MVCIRGCIEEHKLCLVGSSNAHMVLICPMMSEQLHKVEEHWQRIKELSLEDGVKKEDFLLAAVEVKDWNGELSPWRQHIEGIGDFSGKADKMLDLIIKQGIPAIRDFINREDVSDKHNLQFMIGGYSLAGLFALWSMYQTDVFCGAACCSGSLWYPKFIEFARTHTLPKQSLIYLSLGTKEETTGQGVFSKIGDATRELYAYYKLSDEVKETILKWNPGNHFKDVDARIDRGFAWLINKFLT